MTWNTSAKDSLDAYRIREDRLKYYFDIRDGVDLARDDIGVDLPNPSAARLQATIALTEMARDYLPSDGDRRRFTVHVRSAEGPQFDVTLDYELEDLRGQ